MSDTFHLPYTKLFLHDSHSIVLTANGHIQILDSKTGSVLHSTAANAQLTEKVLKSGSLVAATVDKNLKYLVTTTSDKCVRVWEVDGLRIVSEREAPKKPTDVYLTSDCGKILVSDKFGDVHSYPLLVSDKSEPEQETATSEKGRSKAIAKRVADGSLLLGHVSLLTTVLLSRDEKFIITADRDEHIRISWYPEAYIIERFCLGHKKFVSALSIPPWDASLLVSGGGDPEIRVWDWMEGKLLQEIPISEAVMPHVKVIRKKVRGGEDGSDGDGEASAKTGSAGKRNGRRKKKGKGEGKEKPEGVPDADEENVAKENADKMQVEEQEDSERNSGAVARNGPETKAGEPTSPLLAVQKIAAVEIGTRRFLIFSAHGATALFYCMLQDVSGSAPQIHSIPLDQPVLDFIQWPNSDEVWIAVDGNWSEADSSRRGESKLVRIVKAIGDDLILSDSSAHQALSDSLNTTARLEAPQDSLKDIDLYSALVVLPKNVDAEHNAMDDEAQLSEATAARLSGKELGRLKAKQAMLVHQVVGITKRDQAGAPDDNRDMKRQKSETEVNDE